MRAKKEGKFSDIGFKQAKNDAFNAIRTEKSVAEEQKQEEEPKQEPAEEVVAEDKKIKAKVNSLVKRHGNVEKAIYNMEKTIGSLKEKLADVDKKIADTPDYEDKEVANLDKEKADLKNKIEAYNTLKAKLQDMKDIAEAVNSKPMTDIYYSRTSSEPYTETDSEEAKLVNEAIAKVLDNIKKQGFEVETEVSQAEMWDRVGEDAEMELVIKDDDKREITIVEADKNHGFKNFTEAKRWAKNNIVGEHNNAEVGSINVSNTSIDKYLSQKAVAKSDNIDVHLSALKVIPTIIENSVVGEIHNDKKGDRNIRDIVRLYGCISIDGTPYRVKSTVKRYVSENEKTKSYSYEVTEIELLEGEHGDGISELPQSSNNSIPATKLVNKNVISKNSDNKLSTKDFSVIFNDDDIKINDIAEFMQDRRGTIYGFADGNKITLSEEGMNPNAPVPEYTHLWARAVEQKNPKLWKKFVDLAKQTDV